jgi:hypothetical protein
MKSQSTDEIMAEVHAAKDALSREANYDVKRLIAASRARAGAASSPKPANTKKRPPRRKPKAPALASRR